MKRIFALLMVLSLVSLIPAFAEQKQVPVNALRKIRGTAEEEQSGEKDEADVLRVGQNGALYDEMLDAAFYVGSVRFAHADYIIPDPAECEIIMPPAELWKMLGIESVSEQQIRQTLAQSMFIVVNYAPDGSHGIGIVGINDVPLSFAFSPERISIICLTEERGVFNEVGMLGIIYSNHYLKFNPQMPLGMGDEGIIWSPGGRYFCILNSTAFFQQMRQEYAAPVIIDTYTGEMFAVDSFGNRPMAAGYGAWITGCFSEDEQHFYAMIVSDRYSSRYELVRYDLNTFECTPISGFACNPLPVLTMLTDGSFVSLIDTTGKDVNQALVRVAEDGAVAPQELLAKGENWRSRATRAYSSAESGWTLLRGALLYQNGDQTNDISYLLRKRVDEADTEWWNTIWTIDAETCQPHAYNEDDISNMFSSESSAKESVKGHMAIVDAKLSPNGKYAALLLVNREKAALIIVRLEDMKALEAQGVELGEYYETLKANYSRSLPFLSWSEAGIMLMGRDLWQIQTGE